MSDILERLKSAGTDIIEDRGPGFVDDLLDDAEGLAEKHVPEELRGHAVDAVGILRDEKVKAAAVNLAKHGFTRVVGLFESGKVSEAKQVHMETQATAAERIAFMEQAGDDAELLHAKRELEWEALEEALKRIGKVAVKALGFLLLGQLGL